MTEKYITYRWNGRTFDVPESQSAEMEKNYPDATIEMRMGDRSFDVPLAHKQEALDKYGSDISFSFDRETEVKPEPKQDAKPVETEEQQPSFAPAEDDAKASRKAQRRERWNDRLVAANDSLSMAQHGLAKTNAETHMEAVAETPQGERPSWGESLLKGAGAGFTRAGKGLYDALIILSSNNTYIDPLTGELVKTPDYDTLMREKSEPMVQESLKAGEVADRLSKEADPTGGEKGFVDLIAEGKIGTALQKGLATGAESLPMTLSAYNPYTMALNMVSMAGANYAEQTLENPEVDKWKRATQAIGSAALEQAVEKFADPIFKYIGGGGGTGEFTESIAREILEDGTREATESISKRILNVLKGTAKDALGEGAEEVITSFGNDALGEALDLIDGDKDYGIRAQWEQMKEENPDAKLKDFATDKAKEYMDAFIGGALSGAYMSGTTQSIGEAVSASNDRNARNAMTSSYETGASMDYGDMYDTDTDVNDAVGEVASSFMNENGDSAISNEFIESLSAEDAFTLSRREEISPEQRKSLGALALAKARQEGLNQKLDERLESNVAEIRARIADAAENGQVVSGMYNGNVVYVKGGVVNNGSVALTADGVNGPVVVVDSVTGEKTTVNSNEINSASVLDAETLGNDIEAYLRDSENKNREAARNTMSLRAKTKAAQQFAGRKIMVDLGNGLTEVEVQRVNPKSGTVVIKGKKGDLGGHSIVEMRADVIYDSIYRDDDGNPVFPETQQPDAPQVQPEEAPQAEAPQVQPDLTGDEDFRDFSGTIVVNGVPVNVDEVTSQDNTADRITYTYTDENGNRRTASTTVGGFASAVQQAAAQNAPVVPEAAPAGEVAVESPAPTPAESPEPTAPETAPTEAAPLTPEGIDWDALFEQDKEAYFAEVQKQFGDEALDVLNEEIQAAQQALDALAKAKTNSQNERLENRKKKAALQGKIDALNEMIARLTAAPTAPAVPEAAPVGEQPAPTEPVTPAPEAPSVPQEPAPVTPAEGGYIIKDGKIINPTVIEMPSESGNKNRIYIAEKDGKWGYGFHAITDDGNESWSDTIQLELLRYDSKEDAIKGALSYLNTYKGIKKDSPSTGIDAFIQYVNDTYFPTEPAPAAPETPSGEAPAGPQPVTPSSPAGQSPTTNGPAAPAPKQPAATPVSKGGALARLISAAKAKAAKIAAKAGMKDFVGTDKLKPVLTGIYRSGGYEYASDGHVLAKVKAQYPAEQEGKIFSPKTGQEINGTFPKSDLIIDEALKRPEVDVDLDQIIAYTQALEDIKKGLNKNALLYVKIGNNHFKSDVLLTAAKMAKKHGLTKAHHDESGKFAMAFTGENGTVLVMPVNPSMIGDSTRILDASTGSITFSSYSTFIKTPTTLKGIEAARESLEAILPNIGEDYIENAKDGGWLKLVDGKVMFMFDASEIADAKRKANDPNTFKALEGIEKDGLEIPLSASEIAKLFPEVAAPTAPDAPYVPAVAPNPVENPIAEAGKKERQLATNLKKVGLSPEQKQDLAFNAGKAIADMFATREEFDAYAENATDFGAYNADFEKGVDASFASRQQNVGNSPVNSVPLENEPNGENNGEQGEGTGNGQGTGNTGGGTGNTGNQAGNPADTKGESGQGKGGRKGGKKSGQVDKYPARKGNATQKLLVDTFGFASVKIPNSRKETLNTIYDFMMEMAKVLGISPKSIGNGGWVTVDSLRGNSTASARHTLTSMVVDQTVVASTLQYKYAKLMGIAHEWWHALDHVLAFFNTGKGKVVASELPKSKFTGREETYDAVQQVIQAIKDSGHADRMRSLNVPMRYRLYLLENSEMAARAFDEYIKMKFAEAGISIVGTADTLEEIQPTKEEMAVIAPALDNLFNVLQEKEGKTPGTSVLYNIGEEMDPQSDAKKLATEAILTALDDGNRDVEILSDEQAEEYLKMIGADTETQFSIDTDKPIFLSNAAIAVQGIKQEKATPEQWLKMIEKAGGLKAGEDKWMGLSDWLKASDKKTLTKHEVLGFINENTIRIEEVNYKQWDALDYIDEAVKILEAEMREIGWDAMVEKYPRFDELFEEYDGELMWSETRASVAEYEQFIFDEHNLLERPINDTREKYTTDGLDNKKEIAIIVPTIEPWSKSDVIHFGDAGDGRAVAWVRFGEARTYSKEYSDFYDFQKKMQQKYYSDRVIAALSDSDLDALTAEEREEFMRLRDIARSVPFGKRTNRRILVIDEIQSKRHQDAREKGGYRDNAKIAVLKAKGNALLDEKVELTKEILHKFGVIHYIETGTPGKFDPELQEKAEKGQIGSQEQMARMKELDAEIYATFNERYTLANGIPDAPFDKNWSELAMKRMLRYAAENGYDAIAWTKGDQQAERYDIGGAVDSIYYAGSFKEGIKDIDINLDTRRGGNIHLQVDNNGEVINEYNDFGDVKDSPYIGKNLSEILGKELANKVLSLEEEQSLSGEGLRVGGEGMKGFYDRMLPAFMNKYGKKWGVKVSDITLPHVEKAGRVMHSVPVNDAMRESVMEGQPMFYKTPNGTVYGWTDGKKIYLTKAGLNPNTPIHEYTHLWAKAMMLRNPKGWESIKKLLKGTPVWNEVINDPNYSNIRNDEDAVASEALSRISGSENAAKMEQMAQKMIDEAKGTGRKLEARGLIQNMRDALNKFWEFVWTDLFKMGRFRSVEHVTDRILFDLLNNTDLGTLSEGQVEAQIVTDPKVIAELEASPKRAGYRNVVQNEDGTFSSPMAYWLQGTKTRGGAKSRVETAKFELGKWEEAEEHPDLVDDNGHVVLVKPDKNTVEVAYDPYIHNRLDPVNLQFKAAWKRSELVYVETEVPETDLNSGYHAEGALLPVGVHSWSNGDLMLSKYDKPVRIVPWEEVADAWVERLNGEGVEFDVVPAALRPLLVERGVEIIPPHKGSGKDCVDAYDEWKNSNSENNSVSLPNVSQAIETGVWNDAALNELNKITEDVEEGKAILKRYTSSELTGLLEGGRLLVGASIISRGSERNVSASRGRAKSLEGKAEETIPAITAWAKSIGAWRDYSEKSEEEIAHSYLTSGGEAQVFYLGNGKVEKIIGLDYFVDPQLAIDRIAIHNSLFEETQLKVTGFGTNKDGKFAIIVEQPTIIGKHTDNSEIDFYIESIGFNKVDDATRTFANEELYLSDLHEENVLNQNHERYYVIDGDFRLNTPEAGISGTRAIDDRIVRNDTDGLLFRGSDSPITPEMDAEYLAAVESGDMETAQRMVLEAAKLAMPNTKVVDENGNPLVMYHGSPNKFTTFDIDKFGRTDLGSFGKGFYFTSVESRAKRYGENVVRVFLNVENPINAKENEVLSFVFGSKDKKDVLDRIFDPNDNAMSQEEKEIAATMVNDDIVNESKNYDGVDASTARTAFAEVVVRDPSQIKSADPVTYDDAGNVISLSQRFNPEKSDIRYRKAEAQNAAVDYLAGEPRLRAIENAVNEEASKLGVKVTYKTREQMPNGHQNDKGYYNTKTGEIVICTENASSIADAIQTILHEAVAHKGLRQLMGDKFNEFINRVYDSLDAEMKAKVDALAESQYNGNKMVAMEEYMATLAESSDFKNDTLWDKIKSIFEDIINAILGRNDIKIGDNELRYILRASYNNMVNPRGIDSIRGWAQDQIMREEYKINEATPELLSRTGIDPTEIATETAGMVYDRVVRSNWQEFQRQFQDAMQPVRIAIDAIQQATGNVPIEDYENYLFAQNQASSRSRVEIDDFARRYYSPIIEQVNKIIDTILEARGYEKNDKTKRAEVYKEVRNYLIAKHGLERNEYYQTHKTRRMTAKEMRPELDQAKKDYDDKVNQINADTSLTDAERQLHLRDALDEYNAIVEEIRTREVPDLRDYSGLTSLFGYRPDEFELAEQRAQEAVDNFENAISTDELWAKINAVTDKTLRHSYESGLLSRQQYEDIKAMFEFYIPLRGFDETTAEDVYAYARFEGNRFNPAVHKAEGRVSLADDPIAIIMNMAESEIAQGNKNRAKQALYNFLLNRPVMGPDGKQHQNSLMQIEDVWYIESVDATGNTVYMIAAPDHAAGESWEDFENRMQTLAASDKAFKSKKGKMDITMRFQKQANRDAHYVYLKVNGVEKAIYINGNPKAADAVNGSYRPESKWGEDKLRTINRLISSAFTNYSLEFTARNYFRDMIYSHINIGVRESDPAYRKKFRQNWRHNNMRSVMRMLNAYRAGEYDGAALNEDEAAFVEFMNNGGQTGYTVINSVENHKKELERAIERMQKGIVKGGIKDSTIFRYTLGGIELLNEVSELVTRFAAFKTSRDMGRGVNRAINDAKEITVNFNTKGAQDGKGWMGAVSRYFGWSKFFFNASVQGVQNIKAMAQANKLKFCTTVGGIAGLGFCMPIIVGALAEIFGGDDDDENFYWNIPEYDRQNNLCIPVGSRYAKIPLPIGFREVYAIGDMVAAMAFDKKFERDVEQIGMDIANKIAAVVLPINPLESSANGLSIWHTALYTALPSSLQFPIQNATNIDWKGAPLQKEYTYNENDPQWMKAYASNPDWMTGLSKWCNEHINLDGDFDGMDWSPEKLDNTLSNMFGGVYTLIKKTGKTISMAWDEEERNLSNIPLAGVILGSRINDDERFLTDAYYDMKEYYDRNESRIKRTAKAFGLSLDEVFVEQKGAHQPKMQEIYGNDNFDFMQEWYKGNKELESLKGKIDRREKKLAETDKPSQELIDEIAALSNEYDTKRREFVNDMLELD